MDSSTPCFKTSATRSPSPDSNSNRTARPSRRIHALKAENASSIGLKSGEYAGRKTKRTPLKSGISKSSNRNQECVLTLRYTYLEALLSDELRRYPLRVQIDDQGTDS